MLIGQVPDPRAYRSDTHSLSPRPLWDSKVGRITTVRRDQSMQGSCHTQKSWRQFCGMNGNYPGSHPHDPREITFSITLDGLREPGAGSAVSIDPKKIYAESYSLLK